MMSTVAMTPRPVDALEVLVLVDNVTDSLSTVPAGVINENARLIKAGMREMSGEGKCCPHHGLSLVIAARIADETHHVMFDAGPEAYPVARNGELLAIPFKDIEAVALSHGHWDHAGGLPEAIRRIHGSNGGKRIPVHVNEGMFVSRASALPDGGVLPMKPIPGRDELEAAGGQVVSSNAARTIGGDCFYLSGEIPRVTPYERGMPGQLQRTSPEGAWEADPWLRDERYLSVHVKGKGLVVFSMCSHAGVVNVLTDARSVFRDIPMHAIMGGFHLSGATVEPIIPQTIMGLMSFGLKRIVPAHCTGWRAFTALATACEPGVLIPSAVGRTFLF